jgi:hypothetical protein
MLKVVRWDDEDAITYDPLRMRDVIDLDKGKPNLTQPQPNLISSDACLY